MLDENSTRMLYDSDPRLWGYFIEGSDGHLNENANNERMVSNGTPVKFHSVTLGIEEGEAGDDAAADMATDEARLNAAGAGDEIILNSPPYSVNVALVLAEGTTAKEYGDVSLVPGGAVLPTLCKHKSKKMSCLIPGFAVVVVTTTSHGTDLATAMTFYKAQGRTMSRVLACLNKPTGPLSISFEAVFVFLSRVKYGGHAKITPLLPGCNWDHIGGLRPADNCIAYLNGFTPGGSWSKNKAKEALDMIKRARDLEAQEAKETNKAKKQNKRKNAPKKVPPASKYPKETPLPSPHAVPARAAKSPALKGKGAEGAQGKRCVPKEATRPRRKKAKAAQHPVHELVEISDSENEDEDGPVATLVVRVLSGDEASRESEQLFLSWPDQPGSHDAANFKKKLDGLEAAAVKAAFAKKEQGDSVIVSLASDIGGSTVGISARHFNSLMPKGLVTDEVVNALMSIFQAENTAAVASGTAQRRSHFCSSFFLQRIAFGLSGFDENAARRWEEKCPDGDILSLERVFVPVHVNQNHWAFAVISPRDIKISYFDSIGGSGMYLRILRKLVRVLAGDRTDLAKWTLVKGTSDSMPQQDNSYDCGVFMCAMVRFLATGGSDAFVQSDIARIRRRFAYLILSMGTRVGF